MKKNFWEKLPRGKKTVFNSSGNISKEDVKEAMEYLKITHIKVPHHIYKNLYREPAFEELKKGDTLEILTSYGWIEGAWPEVLRADTHNNFFGGDALLSRFNFASLRVKK